MMAFSSLALSSLLPLLLLLPLSLSIPLLASAEGGFSMELIHRDSPKSPFYDPSKTLPDLLLMAARRSIARADYLDRAFSPDASSDTYQFPLVHNHGSYLMEINIGTPAHKILAVADTNSNLIWTNCEPCKNCYQQVVPLFDPTKSSTYQDIPLEDKTCTDPQKQSCKRRKTLWEYTRRYLDGSYTSGNYAFETFTFDSTSGRRVQLPKVMFGCSHESQGKSFNEAIAGIVGLGGGRESLVSQLDARHIIDNKFSYCLVPLFKSSAPSLMSFGAKAVVSGPNVVSIPFIKGPPPAYYYIVNSLQSLSVNGQNVPVKSRDVMFDSGATYTMLHSDVVQSLADELMKVVKLPKVKHPRGFDYCFDVRSNQKFAFPIITFHFDGASLNFNAENMFIHFDANIVCLAIKVSKNIQVIGALPQQNFHVGYDLKNQKISFAPTDCTKLKGSS